jgi:hypothetical protein
MIATAAALLSGGLVGTLFLALRLPSSEGGGADDRVATYAVAFVAVVGLAGVLALRRSSRIEAVLTSRPWVKRRYRISIDPHGNRRPSLVLLSDEVADEAVFLVSAMRWRVGELGEHDGEVLLTAGDPEKWLVVKPVESDSLFVARRPRMRWWRNRMRSAAMTRPEAR